MHLKLKLSKWMEVGQHVIILPTKELTMINYVLSESNFVPCLSRTLESLAARRASSWGTHSSGEVWDNRVSRAINSECLILVKESLKEIRHLCVLVC